MHEPTGACRKRYISVAAAAWGYLDSNTPRGRAYSLGNSLYSMLALVLGGCLSAPSPLVPNLFVAEDASTCKSVTPSATDEWCIATCTTSCPETICSCGSAEIPFPGTDDGLIPADAEIIPATAPVDVGATGAPLTAPIAPEPAPIVAPEPAPVVAPEPATVVAPEPAPVGNGDSSVPAAKDFDSTSCKTVGAATDEWCMATCSNLECPESNGLCKCGAKAAEEAASAIAAASPAAAAPAAAAAAVAAPSPEAWTGTSSEHNNADWWNYEVGANTSCVSIDPGLPDDWCTITCATGSAGCPPDRCACGEQAKEEAKKIRQDGIDQFNEGQNRAAAAAEAVAAGTPLDITYGLPPVESPVASAVHVDPPVQMDTSCKGIGDFQNEAMDIWCAKNCAKGERYCEVTRCKCGGTPSEAVLEFVKALLSRGKGAGARISVTRSGSPL